jgi:hypothetical protein
LSECPRHTRCDTSSQLDQPGGNRREISVNIQIGCIEPCESD